MSRRLLPALLAASCLPAACGDGPTADTAPPRQPDVLLVSIDTLRADHLHAYGYERETSPELDALASQGMLFEQAISSSSWTLPSHVTLMTGLPEVVHGVRRSNDVLGAPAETLAERFAAAGYATAGFFSGPYLHPHFGFEQGFESYVDCSRGEASETAGDLAEGLDVAAQQVTGPALVAAVGEWLDGQRAAEPDRPCFVFVHMWDVHGDFLPPEPWAGRFGDAYDGPVDGTDLHLLALGTEQLSDADLEHLVALYDAEIAWTDHEFGLLLGQFDARSMRDDLLVAVTADHGEEFFEHGAYGHRKTLHEEAIRVPLILAGPGVPSGRDSSVSGLVDVAPTLLELAGVAPLELATGRSLVARWSGSSAAGPRAPRDAGERVVLSGLVFQGENIVSARADDWKLIVDRKTLETVALYDLGLDPGETNDLAGSGTPLEARSLARTRERLAALKAVRQEFQAGGSSEAALPEALQEQLRAIGYVELEEGRR